MSQILTAAEAAHFEVEGGTRFDPETGEAYIEHMQNRAGTFGDEPTEQVPLYLPTGMTFEKAFLSYGVPIGSSASANLGGIGTRFPRSALATEKTTTLVLNWLRAFLDPGFTVRSAVWHVWGLVGADGKPVDQRILVFEGGGKKSEVCAGLIALQMNRTTPAYALQMVRDELR